MVKKVRNRVLLPRKFTLASVECSVIKWKWSPVTNVRSLLVREMYSDNGTLSPCSLQYWLMNHCVQNTTSRRSLFEKLRNSEIIFLIIVSLKSRMKNSIIQELNAEVDRIIGNKLFAVKSWQRYDQVYKLYIQTVHRVAKWKKKTVYWQNLFMKSFKFVSCQFQGWTSCRSFAPGLHVAYQAYTPSLYEFCSLILCARKRDS